MELHLKIESLGLRKRLIKNIYILKALWISLTGDAAHGLNMSEIPSFLAESYDTDFLARSRVNEINQTTCSNGVKCATMQRRQTKQFLELSVINPNNSSKISNVFINKS